MTRRDLQDAAKRLARPWEIAKAFERSAPIGRLVPAARLGHPDRGAVTLAVNGALRQEGDLAQMIWKVPEMIAYLSEYFELAPGDVILSGTPAGVGAVVRGDRLLARIDGLPDARGAGGLTPAEPARPAFASCIAPARSPIRRAQDAGVAQG